MTGWKFLRAGSVGRLSGFRWPVPSPGHPGRWVGVAGPLRPAAHGVHACREPHLPAWIDDELWEIELSGRVLELEDVLVARRGRLLRRVSAWDAQAARELARACLERARRTFERELAEDVACLVEARRPDAWRGGGPSDPRQSPAATAANVAFVVAHGTGARAAAAGGSYAAAFGAERAWQAAWLRERLALPS